MLPLTPRQSTIFVVAFLVLVYLFNLVMQLNVLGMANPGKVDFRPNDTTISGREVQESVSMSMAGVYSFIVMPFVLAIVVKLHEGTNQAIGNFVLVALHAMTMTMLVTIVMKLAFSRLRPSFLTQCAPDAAALLAGKNSVGGGWFTQNACAPGKDLNNWRRSFPSGHASSTSSSAFIFTILMDRLKGTSPTMSGFLVRSSLSVLALCCAGYVGGTRYLERHHHLSDVLAGFVVGGLIAYIVFRQSPLNTSGDVLTAQPKTTHEEAREVTTDVENQANSQSEIHHRKRNLYVDTSSERDSLLAPMA